jgi:hypothetical protein
VHKNGTYFKKFLQEHSEQDTQLPLADDSIRVKRKGFVQIAKAIFAYRFVFDHMVLRVTQE